MKNYSGIINDSFTYMLESDAKPTILEFNDEIRNLVTYIPLIERYRHVPYHRYAMLDGEISMYIQNALMKLGIHETWSPVEENGFLTLEKVYVFEEPLQAPIDKRTLDKHMMIELTIGIWKKK